MTFQTFIIIGVSFKIKNEVIFLVNHTVSELKTYKFRNVSFFIETPIRYCVIYQAKYCSWHQNISFFCPITGSNMHMHVTMSSIFLLLWFIIAFFTVNFIGFSGLINGLFNIFGVSYAAALMEIDVCILYLFDGVGTFIFEKMFSNRATHFLPHDDMVAANELLYCFISKETLTDSFSFKFQHISVE